jgi:hypothetical protein
LQNPKNLDVAAAIAIVSHNLKPLPLHFNWYRNYYFLLPWYIRISIWIITYSKHWKFDLLTFTSQSSIFNAKLLCCQLWLDWENPTICLCCTHTDPMPMPGTNTSTRYSDLKRLMYL